MLDIERLIFIKNELHFLLHSKTCNGTIRVMPIKVLFSSLCRYLDSLNISQDDDDGFDINAPELCFRCNARTFKNTNTNKLTYCGQCKNIKKEELREKLFDTIS